MNPFSTLDAVQTAYRSYVETFQRFKNPAIRDWVLERVAQGLLWREPNDPAVQVRMARRDAWFTFRGWHVLRFHAADCYGDSDARGLCRAVRQAP